MSRTAIFFATLCLFAQPASAQNSFLAPSGDATTVTLPPDFTTAPTFVPVKAIPAAQVMLGKFPVIFEKTSLSEIREKTNSSKIQVARGGVWDGELLLCYTMITDRGGERIWFTSDSVYGKAGGREDSKVLGMIATTLTGAVSIPRDCPLLKVSLQPVVLNGGISLGMSRDDVMRRLSPKAKLDNGQIRFDYDEPLKANDPAMKPSKATKGMRVGSALTVGFADDMLVTFSAQRITSN